MNRNTDYLDDLPEAVYRECFMLGVRASDAVCDKIADRVRRRPGNLNDLVMVELRRMKLLPLGRTAA